MSEQIDEKPPKVGEAIVLERGLRVILAPNPSPMTYWGTNTYLLGEKDITVIDPGPDSVEHLQAILKALEPGQSISQIVVTHSHKDHSPLAKPLKEKTGAEIISFGDSLSGRSAAMAELAKTGEIGGGEGVDADFSPDRLVSDGEVIAAEDRALKVIHTPGHMGNHISLAMEDACFTGDHIMGWASSLVSPPDGDLTDFMASCERLAQENWRVFYSGHGAAITEPNARLQWLITHRRSREAEILAQLRLSPADAVGLAQTIYHDVNPKLLPAAQRNVLAHLVDLYGRGLVLPQQAFEINATFELV
ncbi:MBL fold metallo-hydrolase [Cognatishimia activa]|uniref:MBL fold metallo-hydrolase n=1 Tax=Cognatishimia activa TaxID=1715691 RepID=UPI00222EDD61|nr:MBL fold metallo-hydrolase [Cognatishimia activa]UZD92103.1 MBL fold metallo-hydrolase [Cognatishimia activa]